ncbi:MAG: BTAD domain-containing putative transcriptional regulator [Kineosporiaceae bacterium]
MTASPGRPTRDVPRLPAQRFAEPTLARPPRRPLRAFAAAVLLVALVVAVPAALVTWAGPPPVPTALPDRDSLTRPVDVDVLLGVLALVVWLAWLQFVVSVAVEAAAAVRGGVLAPSLPLAGPSQRLARSLIAALLLSSALAAQASSASAAVLDALAEPPGPAGASVTAAVESGTAAPGPAATAAPPSADAGSTAGQAPAHPLAGLRVYTVQAPEGRYHDNLWDIAERCLGDGRRYQEIYDLNAGREQPDGRRLELARLIHPGWQLVMPEDAVGVDRLPVAPAEAPAPPLPDHPEPPGDPGPGPDPGVGSGGTGPAGGGQDSWFQSFADDPAGAATAAVTDPPAGWLGGGLLAAAVAGLVAAGRRGRGGQPAPEAAVATEIALRLAADEHRSALVDRALRLLAHRCAESRREVPGAFAAIIDDDGIELRLSPADTSPPAPWEPADEGRAWRLAASALPRRPLPDASPLPYLVGIGRDTGARDVLLNLAAAGGVVALTGSAAVTREVAAAVAVQLAVHPWCDAARVVATVLPAAAGPASGDRLRSAADLGEAVGDGGPGHPEDVLTGRPGIPAEDLPLALVEAPAAPADQRALVALADRGEQVAGVLALGPVPGARWELAVDDAGNLAAPLLGLEVQANRLTDDQATAVETLLAAARRGADREGDPAGATGRPPVPPARPGTDDAAWPAAPARVGLLGPVAVRAPGAVDPERRELLEDVVVHLAAHPGGVHPAVLAAAVWPRGVGDEVRDAAVARARDWLGTDESGCHRLSVTADGRLGLRDVAVDLDVLHALLARSRSESGTAAEAALLRRALRLVRGEVLHPRPAGRFTWLAAEPLERRTVGLVIDAAHRLAQLDLDGDPPAASEAARTGLRCWPAADVCWQDLLHAEHRIGGRPAVAEAADEMRRTYRDLGVEPLPETLALLVDLHPSLAGAR